MWRTFILTMLLVMMAVQPVGALLSPGLTGETSPASIPTAPVLQFLRQLQDAQPTGLVPIYEGSSFTTTYSNAMAAIAFLLEGDYGRARRVFDEFPAGGDPCPTCACTGSYQQYRDAATGHPTQLPEPEDSNDFWIGDNAWLLAALRDYRQATGDHRYDARLQQLADWFACLKHDTPPPGIYSGYRKDGTLMNFRHPEGSIDVYGALRSLGSEDVRGTVKDWLDQAVWVPRGDCFDIGYMNAANLPTDNVSWGYLALGPAYRCLLPYAEALTARTQDRYLIDVFDRPDYWTASKSDEGVSVALERVQHGEGHDLAARYSWDAGDHWFLFNRNRDVDFRVTAGSRFHFWLEGDKSGNRFEVKLQNKTGQWYWYHFPLDFDGWRKVVASYDQFTDFGDNHGVRLGEIAEIEFAVNNESRKPASNNELRVGRTWYQDSGAAYLFPVDGFDAFESEQNWLFVEGTGQMAAAYCIAGRTAEWQHHMDELTAILQRSRDGTGLGLPNILTGGINQPVPESVASSWYVVAAHCVNPFDLPATRSGYLPLTLR